MAVHLPSKYRVKYTGYEVVPSLVVVDSGDVVDVVAAVVIGVDTVGKTEKKLFKCSG